MHSLLQRFRNFIGQENLFQKQDFLLLAVSGGVDSAVLCELCHQAGYSFAIAHCNFNLRDEESERDEEFVGNLSEMYGVPFYLKKFDTKDYASAKKVSIQVAARELRYAWFDELLTNTPKDEGRQVYLLTAHHADDNVETLLMNFFKGTGIRGLRGMLPKKKKIIRPLLFAQKEELLAFAREQNCHFVEDSSNLSDKYTRNYFRNQLIPALQKVYPAVENNLLHNLSRNRDIEILYDQAITLHKKRLLEYRENEIHIPVLKLLKTEPRSTILYEILRDFSFTVGQTPGVEKLLVSESGRYITSSTHRVIRNRKWLIITPLKEDLSGHILIEEDKKNMAFDRGVLTITYCKMEDDSLDKIIERYSDNTKYAVINADQLSFPMLLRQWKHGDYFYPLGMRKKKKISRFLTDLKKSLVGKENTWVLESHYRVVWVVGNRIDDRFRISPSTKRLCIIEFNKSETDL